MTSSTREAGARRQQVYRDRRIAEAAEALRTEARVIEIDGDESFPAAAPSASSSSAAGGGGRMMRSTSLRMNVGPVSSALAQLPSLTLASGGSGGGIPSFSATLGFFPSGSAIGASSLSGFLGGSSSSSSSARAASLIASDADIAMVATTASLAPSLSSSAVAAAPVGGSSSSTVAAAPMSASFDSDLAMSSADSARLKRRSRSRRSLKSGQLSDRRAGGDSASASLALASMHYGTSMPFGGSASPPGASMSSGGSMLSALAGRRAAAKDCVLEQGNKETKKNLPQHSKQKTLFQTTFRLKQTERVRRKRRKDGGGRAYAR